MVDIFLKCDPIILVTVVLIEFPINVENNLLKKCFSVLQDSCSPDITLCADQLSKDSTLRFIKEYQT